MNACEVYILVIALFFYKFQFAKHCVEFIRKYFINDLVIGVTVPCQELLSYDPFSSAR